MTLKEAIKLIQKDIIAPGSVDIDALNKAQLIGVEAMKRIVIMRESGVKLARPLLPGETKD